jgi:hypothetical protein
LSGGRSGGFWNRSLCIRNLNDSQKQKYEYA